MYYTNDKVTGTLRKQSKGERPMLEIQLKNREDFERVVEGQKTVYLKRTPHGFTYYVLSEYAGVGIINVFKSKDALKFTEDFEPDKSDGINVAFLVEIEHISLYEEGFHEQ
jgi:hypothetical protein